MKFPEKPQRRHRDGHGGSLSRARGPGRAAPGSGRNAPRGSRGPALHVVPDDYAPVPGVPATRGDCVDGPRPCPYLRCKHHLWLKLGEERDGNPARAANDNTKPKTVFWPTSPATCALDIAARTEELTNREVGEFIGVLDEQVRRIVKRALGKLRALGVELGAEAANDNASRVDPRPFAFGGSVANDNVPASTPLVTIRRKEPR